MLEYQRAKRIGNLNIPDTAHRRSVSVPCAGRAANAQRSGIARFSNLMKSLSDPSIGSSPPDASSLSQAEQDAIDLAVVDTELANWEAAGVITDPETLEDLDLVRYWDSPVSA